LALRLSEGLGRTRGAPRSRGLVLSLSILAIPTDPALGQREHLAYRVGATEQDAKLGNVAAAKGQNLRSSMLCQDEKDVDGGSKREGSGKHRRVQARCAIAMAQRLERLSWQKHRLFPLSE
jgi:hypothetical protein